MRALRSWLERPIADHDRRRAFAAAAISLVVAAVALSVTADPPDRQPTVPTARPPTARPADAPPRPAGDVPAEALDVARRFVDGYVAHFYGSGQARDVRGASRGLRRRLIARPVRVSPAMRRQRPRVERIDGQPLPDGWLVEADIVTAAVSFPVVVVVADRPGGPVVTRLVED